MTEKNEKSFTQKTTEPLNNNNKFFKIAVGSISVLAVGGISVMALQNKDSDKETTKSATSTTNNATSAYNQEYASKVDASAKKSLEDKVINYTEAPFTDNYKLDDSHLNYLNSTEAKELLAGNKKLVVYVGRPNCPYCHMYRQVQDPVLKELDKDIYSIDTIYARYDTELYTILSKQLDITSVPTVVVIENGKITKDLTEDLGSDYMNKEKVKEWFSENLD